ncbi:MAG: hypothetical protein O3C28_12315 [Proteobacteria bacterium]|nr:hypothetical protein [Pseudomonadota bacterium]
MPRYYDVEADLRFVALDLSEQLRPGTFEHALSYLIDHELDISHFDARYRNDDTGAPASIRRRCYSRSSCSLIHKA